MIGSANKSRKVRNAIKGRDCSVLKQIKPTSIENGKSRGVVSNLDEDLGENGKSRGFIHGTGKKKQKPT